MFKNFLLLTVRSLLANRLFTAINIVGLAVGLACVIFIALFVRHETSYDQHWTDADRTYKVMRTFFGGSRSQDLELATNAPQTGPMLAQDFSKLVLFANVIAWPVAWYFMNNWLESFAYRVSLSAGIFIFAAFLAWLIAAATVGGLSAFTANANPTRSLRYE